MCGLTLLPKTNESLSNLFFRAEMVNNDLFSAEGGSRGRVSSREVARLRQHNQTLLEENNLLKLKVELLLDMVSFFFSISHRCILNMK